MSFLFGKRPSPAMVVAILALSFALAGSAIAGTEAVTSKLDRKEKRQVKRIAKQQANRQISQRAPGLRVAHAETADRAAQADNAAHADNSTKAANAADADKLDGLDANQLARATTATAFGGIDNFDAEEFTDLITRSVTAPVDGVLLLWGEVNVNRDTGHPDPTVVEVRGAVDGAEATIPVNVRATEDGAADQSVSVSGAVPIEAGDHTVALQGREVSTGVAFLTERSITTLFVPFGNSGTQGQLDPAPDPSLPPGDE